MATRYGVERGWIYDSIMWVVGTGLIFVADLFVRGLTQAIGEVYAFIVYTLGVGLCVFVWRLARAFFYEAPSLVYSEVTNSISALEARLESRYMSTDLQVEPIKYPKTGDEQWIGLKITNAEDVGIIGFYVMLNRAVDKTGANILPIPVTLDWSSLIPPTPDYRLPRGDTRYIDVAQTIAQSSRVDFTLFGARRRPFVGVGEYKLDFTMGGRIRDDDIRPQAFSATLVYTGGIDLDLVNLSFS